MSKGHYDPVTYPSAREWRAAVLRRDNWTCLACGARHQDAQMAAHHVVFKSHCAEQYKLDPRNGVTLCGDWTFDHCHRSLHDGNLKLAPSMLPPDVIECLAEQGVTWIDGEPVGPCRSYFART